MLKKITVKNPSLTKRISSEQKSFAFKPGINLLVGRNGSGKSTIFDLIISGNEGVEKGDFTAEFDGIFNIRAIRLEDHSRKNDSRVKDSYYIYSHFLSHGEANWPLIQALEDFPDNTLLLLDEPEQALDFHRIMELRQLLTRHTGRLQFIIATHHPCLISMPEANCVSVDQDPNYGDWLVKAYKKAL